MLKSRSNPLSGMFKNYIRQSLIYFREKNCSPCDYIHFIEIVAVTTERRSSTNSESSIEPMDISAKTVSTDANSSMTVKSSDQNDSDNINSDHEDGDLRQNIVLRGNLRHIEDSVFRNHYRLNLPNKNNNNHFHKTDKSPLRGTNISESFSDANDNMHSSPESMSTNNRNNDSRYACPICGVMSDTQHEFTEHIRGHNSMDDAQNFTCQICHKVCMYA